MSSDYDDDDLEQGPKPPHWGPAMYALALGLALLGFVLTSCSTTRHYPKPPTYTTMIVIEGSNE